MTMTMTTTATTTTKIRMYAGVHSSLHDSKYSIAQWIATLHPEPAAPGLNQTSGVFSEKIYDGAVLSNSALPLS